MKKTNIKETTNKGGFSLGILGGFSADYRWILVGFSVDSRWILVEFSVDLFLDSR